MGPRKQGKRQKYPCLGKRFLVPKSSEKLNLSEITCPDLKLSLIKNGTGKISCLTIKTHRISGIQVVHVLAE